MSHSPIPSQSFFEETMQHPSTKTPSVVPRSEIPVSPLAEEGNLEVRPFLAHSLLGSMLPASAATLAWTHARPGSSVALRSHPVPGLLIVLEGGAELIGRLNRAVEPGDVITLPSDHEYGFENVGPAGLNALYVAFHEQPSGGAGEAHSLSELLARNEVRVQLALNNAFFSLLRNGGVDSERKRATMRECLRVFSDAFQTFLFTRQATCRDRDFAAPFHGHLLEELGHNELLAISGSSPIAHDSILIATSNWFCHQMLVLDNAEKAVVNLALESAGYYLGTLSMPLFVNDESRGYFDTHAEDDAHHKELGAQLLDDLHPHTYARLQRVLDSSWDMIEAMTARFAYLIELGARSS
jgi:hypothetical protein